MATTGQDEMKNRTMKRCDTNMWQSHDLSKDGGRFNGHVTVKALYLTGRCKGPYTVSWKAGILSSDRQQEFTTQTAAIKFAQEL